MSINRCLIIATTFMTLSGAAMAQSIARFDFETGVNDPRLNITAGSNLTVPAGAKPFTGLAGLYAFGFGRTNCGGGCQNSDANSTLLTFSFGQPTFVSHLSFIEREAFGNWGSLGEILTDGTLIAENPYFGRFPYNDFQPDSTFRNQSRAINKQLTSITLRVRDITNQSEIFLDNLAVFAVPGLMNPSASAPALFSGTYVSSLQSQMAVTAASMQIAGGSTFTQGPLDAISLASGSGTLTIAQGALFTANGLVNGNIVNAGLIRIPIQALPQAQGGRVVLPSAPSQIAPLPVAIAQATFVGFANASTGSSGTGGPTGGVGYNGSAEGFGSPGQAWLGSVGLQSPRLIQFDTPAAANGGTFSVDASLEVTGSFTQTASGQLRLFVAGNTPADLGPGRSGGNYSQLFVGKSVSLNGQLQIVLQPELFALFGYTPKVGDTFDFVVSSEVISLLPTLSFAYFVTAEGRSMLSPQMVGEQYESNSPADPDRLYSLTSSPFAFQLIESDSILRATLVQPALVVPEPSSVITMLSGLLLLATVAMRRREA